jgi:hypothetical protein
VELKKDATKVSLRGAAYSRQYDEAARLLRGRCSGALRAADAFDIQQNSLLAQRLSKNRKKLSVFYMLLIN